LLNHPTELSIVKIKIKMFETIHFEGIRWIWRTLNINIYMSDIWNNTQTCSLIVHVYIFCHRSCLSLQRRHLQVWSLRGFGCFGQEYDVSFAAWCFIYYMMSWWFDDDDDVSYRCQLLMSTT
jgi:hypothetical protein